MTTRAIILVVLLMGAPLAAHAAPTRTGTASEVDASGGNGSTSVTVPADADLVVAFWSHWDNNGGSSISALTLNGAGFSIVQQQTEGAFTDENGVGIAILENPSTGSQTFAWNWSGGGARAEGGEIVLVYVKDANIGDAVRSSGLETATFNLNVAVTLSPTQTTDLVLAFAESFDSSGNPDITSDTNIINNALLNSHLYDVGQMTAESPSMTINMTGEDYSSMVAIALKESGGGAPAGATALSRPPNNLGLLGYWSFNDGTGTRATDFSGRGNYGTLLDDGSGLPTWADGRHGKALRFYNAQVDMGDINAMDGLSAVSVSAWIKAASSGVNNGEFPIIAGKGNCSNGAFSMFLNNGNIAEFGVKNGLGSGVSAPGDTNVDDGNWHHLVGTYDGSTVYTYVDGVEEGSAGISITLGSDSNSFEVGGDCNGDFRYYEGTIDDVRVYSRAITAAEVAKMHRAGAARLGASSVDLASGSSLEQGLVGHWTFDGKDTNWTSASTGTTLDRSGNGNTGTMTNMSQKDSISRGVLGQGFVFDGSLSHVSFGNDTSIASVGSGNSTLAAWVRSSEANDGDIINVGTLGDPGSLLLQHGGAGAIRGHIWTTGGSGLVEGAQIRDGAWHHAVQVVEGSTISVYVDGEFSNSDPITGTKVADTGGVYAGTRDGDDGNYMGEIDDVRIYNRALTAAEIKQLYNLGKVKITQ